MVISYCQEGGISSDKKAYLRALELILDRHSGDFNQVPMVLMKNYIIVAKLLVCTGRIKKGFVYLLKAAVKFLFK